MNRGLPEQLKLAFPSIVPVERPIVFNQTIPNPNWIAGFTSAEGSLIVEILKSKTIKLEEQVRLIFKFTQHKRDEQLMRSLIPYFGCGAVYNTHSDVLDFKVTQFTDIVNKIIPFFKKHKIIGVKYKNFENWCEVAELMKEKKHLTAEGLEQIKKIKASGGGANFYFTKIRRGYRNKSRNKIWLVSFIYMIN